MERTKKQEKLILVYFAIFLLLILIIAMVTLVWIVPEIKNINTIKNNTLTTYNSYVRIGKEGMTYSEFSDTLNNSPELMGSGESGEYTKEVVRSMDENFYGDYFINGNSGTMYSDYIKEQKTNLDGALPIDKKNEIVSQILPVYSELISDLQLDGTLSDFKFINYVESILETFSLRTENGIGISEIDILEGYSIGVLDNSLETNIYYIPLSLSLVGSRSDVLDFIYYAGRVGEIIVQEDNLELNTTIDEDFKRSFSNRVLRGQDRTHNIFNNQIFDIESIAFEEYIDPSITISERYRDSSLINYIKNTNFGDSNYNYKINVSLKFYIKGLPVYRIQTYVRSFINEFNKIESEVNTNIGNTELNTVNRQKLMEVNNVLKQLRQSIIPDINKNAASQETLNKAYGLVNDYYPTINEYRNILNQINGTLGSTAK